MTASKSLYNQLVEALEYIEADLTKVYEKNYRSVGISLDKARKALTALKAHGKKVDIEGFCYAKKTIQDLRQATSKDMNKPEFYIGGRWNGDKFDFGCLKKPLMWHPLPTPPKEQS